MPRKSKKDMSAAALGAGASSAADVASDLHDFFMQNDCPVSVIGEGVSLSEPTGYLSLPIDILNYALGGVGIPYGKVTEVSGPSQSGKTVVILAALQENIRRGGVSLYLDTEFATSKATAKEMAGVDENELLIGHPKYFDSAYNTITGFVKRVNERWPDRPIAIGVDSVAALKSRMESEAGFEEAVQLAIAPKLIRKFFRLAAEEFATAGAAVLISNHEIANVGAKPWEPKVITVGGSGIKYWASVRIRVQQAGYERDKENNNVAVHSKLRATIVKSRDTAPERQVEFFLNLTPPKGFNNALSTFNYLYEQKFFSGAAGWYSVGEKKFRKEDLIEHINSGTEIGNYLKDEAKKLFLSGWSFDAIDPLSQAMSELEDVEE